MPAFFIQAEEIQGSRICIRDPALLRHLIKSLRVRRGETIAFTDPCRRRYQTKIVRISASALEAMIVDSQAGPSPSPATVILGQAMVKSDKMALIVQKATELGISRICPLVTERSLIKMDARLAQRYSQRLSRIAHEAAQQSERWDVPTIGDPCTLERFLLESQSESQKVFLVARNRDTAPLTKILMPHPAPVTLVIGPEGGWTERELALAREAGFRWATLGERILRTETAALVAICLAQNCLGNL